MQLKYIANFCTDPESAGQSIASEQQPHPSNSHTLTGPLKLITELRDAQKQNPALPQEIRHLKHANFHPPLRLKDSASSNIAYVRTTRPLSHCRIMKLLMSALLEFQNRDPKP